jgi:hypothetical protein
MYLQITGLPMGLSISGTIASLFIEHIEKTILSQTLELHIGFYERYVDDTIILTGDKASAKRILNRANQLHPGIKFEIEHPKNEGINFLDLTINISNEGTLHYEHYVKQIKKPIFVHYTSNEPLSRKISYIRNEAKRIRRNCLQRTDTKRHINKFKFILRSNGYPWWLINESMGNEDDGNTDDDKEKKEQPYYISFPFINEKINREITKISRKMKINIRCAYNNKNLASILKPKMETSTTKHCAMKNCQIKDKKLCFVKYIVYEAICLECNKIYIGSTTRCFHIRAREHMNNGALKEHSKTCNKTMQYTFKILSRCRDELDTRISEAQHIKQKKPLLNRKEEIVGSLCFL